MGKRRRGTTIVGIISGDRGETKREEGRLTQLLLPLLRWLCHHNVSRKWGLFSFFLQVPPSLPAFLFPLSLSRPPSPLNLLPSLPPTRPGIPCSLPAEREREEERGFLPPLLSLPAAEFPVTQASKDPSPCFKRFLCTREWGKQNCRSISPRKSAIKAQIGPREA